MVGVSLFAGVSLIFIELEPQLRCLSFKVFNICQEIIISVRKITCTYVFRRDVLYFRDHFTGTGSCESRTVFKALRRIFAQSFGYCGS